MNNSDLAFLFAEVARLSRKKFNQQMESLNLTHAQCRVLLRLRRFEGLRQVELAKLLEIQPITLVKQLDQLVELGLIERRMDETDRRAFRLFLCPAATPMLLQIESKVDELMALMMADVSEELKSGWIEVLQMMKLNLADAEL